MKRIFSLILTALMLSTLSMLFVSANDSVAFEFNKDGDFEDWRFQNAEGDVKGGYLTAEATPNTSSEFQRFDPAVKNNSLSFEAKDYGFVHISMKYEMKTKDTDKAKLFFKANDLPLDEARTIVLPISSKTSNDKYVDFLFDMTTNAGWKGEITELRFDPFDDEGSFSIDFIRVLKKAPEGLEVKEETPEKPKEPEKPTTPEKPKEENRFPEINRFSPSTFRDLPTSAWYYSYVSNAYKIGLMNGKAEHIFEPDETVTVAEAITLAARVNLIYNGKASVLEAKAGEDWYKPYVDVAIAANIIKANQFSNYGAIISRADMGSLFSKALPNDYYNAVNKFDSIPDIDSKSPFFNDIIKLYNAGIIIGVDDDGNYNPNESIKRSEVSAIITRVAIKSERLVKESAPEVKEPEVKEPEVKEPEVKEPTESEKERAERVKATAVSYSVEDKNLDKLSFGNIENEEIKDGFLKATGKQKDNQRYDPIVYLPTDGIDINKHQIIRVAMKWDADESVIGQKPCFYFLTEESPEWAEDKRVSAQEPKEINKSKTDDVVEYVFNMSENGLWKGTLKNLRFDPFDAKGTFYIKYIVLEEK